MSSRSEIQTKWHNYCQGSFYLHRIFAAFLLILTLSVSANAETRKLKLYYLHTGEKATIAYKKNGKFLPAGLKRINVFLRDWRRNEPTRMDPLLMDLIWEVYKKSGSKDYIHVISGYRSPATNNMLRKRGRGVAKKSQHTLGKALDFFLPDVKLAKLRKIGLIKQVGGVGYYPRSGSPFVHMDTGRVRHWPRMTRKQLVQVFPNGKTLHVPTDGKPLPGYNQAVASFNARKSSTKKVAQATGTKKERKSFFQRLAALRNGDDDESVVNNTPAPRKVKTTNSSDNGLAPLNPDAPIDSPPSPNSPENLPLIASIPVPRSAPRNEFVSSQNTTLASLDNNTGNSQQGGNLVASIDDSQTLDSPEFNIPVPRNRPDFAPILVAKADIAPLEPLAIEQRENLSSFGTAALETENTNDALRTRLIAQANNQLRARLLAPPRPSAEVGSEFVTALLPQQNDTSPVLTRSFISSDNSGITSVAQTPDETTIATDQKPRVTPSGAVPVARPQFSKQTNSVLALSANDGTDITTPENLAAAMAKQAETLSGNDDNSSEDISQIILAAIPTRSPLQEPAPATVIAQNDTPTSIDLSQTTSQEIAALIAATPEALDDLPTANYEQDDTANLVLVTSLTINATEQMRAPAYGRAAIRQSPETVLTAGFNPSGSIQNAMRFSGKAVNFQSFTKYN